MKNRTLSLCTVLVLFFIITFVMSLLFGSTQLNLLNALLEQSLDRTILIHIRLPRVISAMMSGMALSVSGLILQGILSNSLAGPNTIGVNSGAGFGAMLAMALLPNMYMSLPVMAFFGSLITTLIVFAIASKTSSAKLTTVLAGIALGSILSAGMDAMKIFFDDIALDSVSFLIGGFEGVSFNQIALPSILIVIALFVSVIFSRAIDMLALGEECAKSFGLNVSVTRFILILLSSLLASSAVCFSGLLGFVGLIVPHMVRRVFHTTHRVLLPVTAVSGGAFVMLCDLIGRTLFAPFEIPVGIIMSLIGAPFFIYLLMTRKYDV